MILKKQEDVAKYANENHRYEKYMEHLIKILEK